MLTVPSDQLNQAIAILGSEKNTGQEIEEQVAALTKDGMTARRLIDWIPEAFGIVLIAHIGKVDLPTTFKAKSVDGEWVEFDFKAEPLFEDALRVATEMHHSGPRGIFSKIATRSAMVAVVNNALNAGSEIEGARLSGPKLIGIPAEMYGFVRRPFWKRLFRGKADSSLRSE